MTKAIRRAVSLADEIEDSPLGRCGPSDDPDMQYAYAAGFRDLATRFASAVRRIGDPDLAALLPDVRIDTNYVSKAHDLRAELYVVIEALREIAEDPEYPERVARAAAFLDPGVLDRLRAVPATRLDQSKLVRFCEELNDAYARGNYLSAILLLRAIMNHVPPVFGAKTYSQSIATLGRSLKSTLEELTKARPIADLHTHLLMRRHEAIPSRNQLEPFKPAFEHLINATIEALSSGPPRGSAGERGG